MKNKKIIIAGGSGFIGQALCNYFGADNDIVLLSRNVKEANNTFGHNYVNTGTRVRKLYWDGITPGEWVEEINNADIVINLAGKSVNCRYTPTNKKAILDSRINATNALGLAIQNSEHPPALLINAASATIYPHATDTARDETFTGFANDFSVQVCKAWEQAFYEQHTPYTRKIALRMAITLGQAGVMTPYFNLLKFGLGGRQGSGRQMYSWIHVEDTCRMVEWLYSRTELEGTFNCCSPNPVSNAEFMQTLRTVTGCRLGLPAYTWMLKIGAAIIGTETELILKSRWVLPARCMAAGFQFRYPLLQPALEQIVYQTPRRCYQLF
ncbi:MAG TPA: TIGR01777 family oxidoreductase [Ferruginibacter sp.]|nr:TIGR01777 family oxidoreductase [Ferruginibacter sp.]HMP20808.1 TIGR01777 family oxidoreductase [Ferruginibacter sp.]